VAAEDAVADSFVESDAVADIEFQRSYPRSVSRESVRSVMDEAISAQSAMCCSTVACCVIMGSSSAVIFAEIMLLMIPETS